MQSSRSGAGQSSPARLRFQLNQGAQTHGGGSGFPALISRPRCAACLCAAGPALEPDAARRFIGLANVLYDLDRIPETVAAFDTARKLWPTCLNDNDRFI